LTRAARRSWRLPAGRWLALLLGIVALLYVGFVAMMLGLTGPFTYVGIDYRQVWCSVQFARAEGFEHLYDPASQAPFHAAVTATQPGAVDCDTPPLGYLPVFFLLFVPFAVLPPTPGLLLWSAANLVVYVLYVYRFARAVGVAQPRRTTAKLVLAYAFFINLVSGQSNVWLLLCLGESMLAYLGGGSLRAGLWLGGLLLKPPVLILLLPGLLIRREFRLLAGFGVASVVILAGSVALAGVTGMVDFVRLLVVFSGGATAIFPEAMMNWRAFAVNLAPFLGDAVAWSIAVAGMSVTLALGVAVWCVPWKRGAEDFMVALLGCLAATGAVSWHSHVYSGLLLIVPLVYLLARGRLASAVFNAWLVLPAVAFFVAGFGVTAKAAHPAAGLTMLAINVALAAWALRTLWGARRGIVGAGGGQR
jgi:hypothetical protein